MLSMALLAILMTLQLTLTSVRPYAYLFQAISPMARRAFRVATASGGLLVAAVAASCTASTRIRAVSTQPTATIATTVTLSVVC